MGLFAVPEDAHETPAEGDGPVVGLRGGQVVAAGYGDPLDDDVTTTGEHVAGQLDRRRAGVLHLGDDTAVGVEDPDAVLQ